MTDLLLIVEADGDEEKLLDEVSTRHPDRVTVLVADADREWAADESELGRVRRDRLAELLTAIELRTGASVVGLAGDREQLRGWRFDRVVDDATASHPTPLAA